jgi:hypothetical protein
LWRAAPGVPGRWSHRSGSGRPPPCRPVGPSSVVPTSTPSHCRSNCATSITPVPPVFSSTWKGVSCERFGISSPVTNSTISIPPRSGPWPIFSIASVGRSIAWGGSAARRNCLWRFSNGTSCRLTFAKPSAVVRESPFPRQGPLNSVRFDWGADCYSALAIATDIAAYRSKFRLSITAPRSSVSRSLVVRISQRQTLVELSGYHGERRLLGRAGRSATMAFRRSMASEVPASWASVFCLFSTGNGFCVPRRKGSG